MPLNVIRSFDKLLYIRSVMWDFLEKPWTSKAAKLFAFLSLSILFISTVTFIVSTVEEYNKTEEHSTQLMKVCKERFNFIIHELSLKTKPVC